MAAGATDLYWLHADDKWDDRLARLPTLAETNDWWIEAVALANSPLDFGSTSRLARNVAGLVARGGIPEAVVGTIRLAVLSSSTVGHLKASLIVGALRRGFWLDVYLTPYGQYFQELHEQNSDLVRWAPTDVLLSFDARHMTSGLEPSADVDAAVSLRDEKVAHLEAVWKLCRDRLRANVIQQAVLPVFPLTFGNNEHRLPGSRTRFISEINEALRPAADQFGVDVLSVDERCCRSGVDAWHQPTMWMMAKQEIAPSAAMLYGDLVSRVMAARKGRSHKALVLDLDNTLWGGIVGDDGIDGIIVGQGSASGESFLAFQGYVKALAQRGIILAVCSKNDRSNAAAAFEERRDMLLRMDDFAAFEANWDDKATNIRRIAERLNIGLDSLVFVDDNPFERNLVRRELPMVAVPEVSEDPVFFGRCLSDAGYFEGIMISEEDRRRSSLYAANAARSAHLEKASDLDGYLKSLQMKMIWQPFTRSGLPRILQLVNKTNQYNLMTRRYSEEEIIERTDLSKYFTLQIRIVDRFGDNGMIAVVVGEILDDVIQIESWLMSCRVLGRQVEHAMLNLLVERGRALGIRSIAGQYRATGKNEMVRDHYEKLGFTQSASDLGGTFWTLDVDGFEDKVVHIEILAERAT